MCFLDTKNICIEYKIVKCKGDDITPPSTSIDIKKVEVWCEAIDNWLDVTEIESQELDQYVMKLIEDQND